MAAHTDRWYFSREQLQNTPSRKCGVEPEKELSYRQQSANLIQDMGQRLQVNQLCINTAIVYMHRFYMFQSFTRFPRNSISAACLFMAAKVEEQPHKLEHVLKVAHLCLHRGAPPLDTKSDTYMQQSQELVINESIILQTFAFDVAVSHPHTHVVKCTQMIRASKDLAQTSYFMATNSLHLTTFCLQYKPTLVACVCVHLACKWSQYEIPKSNDGNYWWEYVDPNVTKDLLDRLTMEFLQIIEACPNRLKRRIAIHKEQVVASKKNKKEGGEDGPSGKPGSQSSLDSGFAELNDESFKPHLQLPSDVSSPWLVKQPKKEGAPELATSDLAAKPSLPEQPQPAKKSLAEYKLQKEKERMIKEKQANEERIKQEKAKMEKRKAYEAQLMKADGKIRPKHDPQHYPKKPHHGGERPHPSGEREHHHPGGERPHAGGERPHPGVERPHHGERHHPGAERPHAGGERLHPHGKGKAEHSGDPHIKHSKEHPRIRPIPPNLPEGSHGQRPTDPSQVQRPGSHHKRPNHSSLTPSSKDARRHPSEHAMVPPTAKMERPDARRMAEAKSKAGGSHRPRPDDAKAHGSQHQPKTPPLHQPKTPPVHQPRTPPVHQPRTPPLPREAQKVDPPSLLQKTHQLLQKTQAQKDEDQRVNDELSDLRDEVMKVLENDASSDLESRMTASPQPIPSAVARKRNSLDKLREAAQQELVHIRKSGTENNEPHGSASRVDNKTGGHSDHKQAVRLKTEPVSTQQEPPLPNTPLSPSKKLKSPVNSKRSREPSTKVNKNSKSLTASSDSPVQKKRALELADKSQSRPKDADQKSENITTQQISDSKPKESKTDEKGMPLKKKPSLPASKLPDKNSSVKPEKPVVKSESKTTLLEKKASKVPTKEKSKTPTPNSAKKSEVESQAVNISPVKSEHTGDSSLFTTPVSEKSKVKTEKEVDRVEVNPKRRSSFSTPASSEVTQSNTHKTEREAVTVKIEKPADKPPGVSPGELPKSSAFTSISSETVQEHKTEQGSPKHKHKHKDKKKHKKHRQEKTAERSASPSVESTSILTTSGGIKLKIKGLSLSGSSPGNPSPKVVPSQEQGSSNGSGGNLKMTLNASPNSGKEHKHRHKSHKSKVGRKEEGHAKKRHTSPHGTSDQVPAKKRAVADGEGQIPQPALSLLSLPMPPPDPKRTSSSPAKHSKHKSRKHAEPPPPPPPPRPNSAESPPPPPPPQRPKPQSSFGSPPLETVTALPPMESMDPNAYGNQYLGYVNAASQGKNGPSVHKHKKHSHRS